MPQKYRVVSFSCRNSETFNFQLSWHFTTGRQMFYKEIKRGFATLGRWSAPKNLKPQAAGSILRIWKEI